MAAHGEIEPPDAAIFADTGWEPRAVYDHLCWLKRQPLPFPIHRVQTANIREAIVTKNHFTGVPWHITLKDGNGAIGRRACTHEYKLKPIKKEIRRLLGKPSGYISPAAVEMWVGISTDEAHRMKPAAEQYIERVYPLIDHGMSRLDCRSWLFRHDYPMPPKSSCIGCPLHDNSYWRNMRDYWPNEWSDAIAVDDMLRASGQYMHQSRVPLQDADLGDDPRQLNLFGEECEGLCGV
jgi:hypothetical protein